MEITEDKLNIMQIRNMDKYEVFSSRKDEMTAAELKGVKEHIEGSIATLEKRLAELKKGLEESPKHIAKEIESVEKELNVLRPRLEKFKAVTDKFPKEEKDGKKAIKI